MEKLNELLSKRESLRTYLGEIQRQITKITAEYEKYKQNGITYPRSQYKYKQDLGLKHIQVQEELSQIKDQIKAITQSDEHRYEKLKWYVECSKKYLTRDKYMDIWDMVNEAMEKGEKSSLGTMT
jgi:hypothetical protein